MVLQQQNAGLRWFKWLKILGMYLWLQVLSFFGE
jgi:hypothetical protein